MNVSFSKICNHNRLQRINNDFVRCLDCGQSMISQTKMISNKTRQDFTKENKSFVRNFNRNFSNILEEVDEQASFPLYEYYADRMMINKIIINRRVQFASDPPKFEVIVNGSKTYLTNDEIQKLLMDANAFRVDEGVIRSKTLRN
ncbi:hypothetical protein QJ856_gp0450 [Tupanvirus deep ocean]|uniref:Uncharacterized protein n=2 Tax=Tupanvirus TaxID=2094720 RepID=A0AC62A9A7_9VIRU|nr:hypothetical protein QJ856_gp0450 [Tupanvirus deep ocean]QKU34294.1 hypothetical protein [Tupanvirus deep ocean]